MKEKKTGLSAREKMLQRKKELSSKSKNLGIIFPKEGTMRVRLINQGPDKELGMEIIQFYLGSQVGGIISPATFDEPCPFMDKYKELKNSDDEEDQQLAKQLVPRRRYIIGGTLYKDEKGREVDTENVCKPILIPGSVYQDIIDLYLDEDDWGDMSDPEDGYDIKITRSGKGRMDTTYSVNPCPKTGKKLDPKYVKEMDLEANIRSLVKPYDELEKLLNNYLHGGIQQETGSDIEEAFSEKKKKKKNKDKKKSRDI
jgi:hypothetical protein|uniref:SsDNA-binding protein n=1 Tax=Myoviridae sp. ctx322 TaxID=2826711 RepID=A0A8S5NAY0_9CAUD|nr:MAG TPA: ssDNA-binding protein [Myoviridae sp. ctx322]